MTHNKVTLIGYLTRDVDVKNTQTTTIANLSVVIEPYGDKDKETYVDVSVFGKTAENCDKYLKKGSAVFVEGKLRTDEFEVDGKKRTKLKVIGNIIQFLSKPIENKTKQETVTEFKDDSEIPF